MLQSGEMYMMDIVCDAALADYLRGCCVSSLMVSSNDGEATQVSDLVSFTYFFSTELPQGTSCLREAS